MEAKYINNQEDPDYVLERGVGYGGSVQDLGSDSDATQPARPVADDRRDTGSTVTRALSDHNRPAARGV